MFLSSYVLHSTPLIDNDRELLYIGGQDRRFITLDLNTGEPVSCYTARDSISASPALLTDGSVVFAAEDGFVYACSPGCKDLLWEASISGPSVSVTTQGEAPPPPAPRPPPSPAGAYASDKPAYFMSSPIVIEGGNLVVAINFNGDLIGVNAKDGIVMWRAEKATWQGKDAGYVAASPAIGKDGSLYIADYSGFLHGFVGNGGCPAGYHLSSNIDDLNCDFGLNCGTVDSSNTTSPPPTHHLAINPLLLHRPWLLRRCT